MLLGLVMVVTLVAYQQDTVTHRDSLPRSAPRRAVRHRAVIHRQRPAEDAADRLCRLDAGPGETAHDAAGLADKCAADMRKDGRTRSEHCSDDAYESAEELR